MSFLCASAAPGGAALGASQADVREGVSPAAPGPAGEPVFVDAMQQAAPWTSAQPLRLDAAGNVRSLQPGQRAETLVFAGGRATPGDYALSYHGRGTLAVDGGAIVHDARGRAFLRVSAPVPERVGIVLLATDPANYVRDVELLRPGFRASDGPFVPAFLRELAGARVVRFDRWAHLDTNDGPAAWPGRSTVHTTQAGPGGVALEYQVALANTLGADPWFALPLGATDLTARAFAAAVQRTLDARLHPTFSIGREAWRPGTPSNAWAVAAAKALHVAGDPQTAARAWMVSRSAFVLDLVEETYGRDASRITRAADVPADGGAVARSVADGLRGHVDALAFAVPVRPEAVAFARDRGLEAFAYDGPATAAALAAWRGAGGGAYVAAPLGFVAFAPPETIPLVQSAPVDAGGVPSAFEPRGAHARPPLPAVVPQVGHLQESAAPQVTGMVGVPERNDDPARAGDDWVRVDGARLTRAPNSRLAIVGDGKGIAVTAPADRSLHVVRVVLAAARARVAVTATLDDGSTQPFVDASLERHTGEASAAYTIVYRAASPSATLTVRATVARAYAPDARVRLRSASLAPYDAPSRATPPPTDQATYHVDLSRSGWNQNEFLLRPKTVASGRFGMTGNVTLDGLVLAQPLFLAGVTLPNGLGTHNLVLVATEHNTLYEIDADSGAIVQQQNFGPSQSSNDVGCTDVEPEYGITSTPVVNRATNTIYLVAATEPEPNVFAATIHAVDIGTLADQVPPVAIAPSEVLNNGQTLSFDNQNQYNRTGLVWANDSLYVGVGSHCDNVPNGITGWMLRYDPSLNPLGAFATDHDAAGYLLSSIWMSGFASAVDENGNLYAVTGNGAFDASHGGGDYGESALALPPDLSSVLSSFTPPAWNTLNGNDEDFGSAGIMLLPEQANSNTPNLAVAMGKSSLLYLLDRDQLSNGKHTVGHPLQELAAGGGGVWGGPTFYSGPTGQFVYYQPGSDVLKAFKLDTDASGKSRLHFHSRSTSVAGYGGSTPVVSSAGQRPGTGIVWLVRRDFTMQLEAYDASDIRKILFTGEAGSWSNPENNGFVTPLVADGHVYVATTNELAIFGLSGAPAHASRAPGRTALHTVTGTVVRLAGNAVTLRLADGRRRVVDVGALVLRKQTGLLRPGATVLLTGRIDAAGAFRAVATGHLEPRAPR